MKEKEEQGIKFWSAMYIPIVVAMSSIQNVAAALSGGLIAIIGGAVAVLIGFLIIPVLSPKEKYSGHRYSHSKFALDGSK